MTSIYVMVVIYSLVGVADLTTYTDFKDKISCQIAAGIIVGNSDNTIVYCEEQIKGDINE